MYDLKMIQQFIEHLPWCKALDINIHDKDELIFELPYSEKLIGDKNNGILHGSVIFALLDTICGAVTYSHPENKIPTATIDLRMDYLRDAVPPKNILAKAEICKTTQHVAFLRGTAWDQNENDPIAMATGTFVFAKVAK